ncbi:MAG: glucosaminidase domain-containing protein [Acidimicrobiia bacterium]
MPLQTSARALTRPVALLCAALLSTLALGPAAGAAPARPEQPDPEAYRALATEVTRNTNRIAQMGAQIDEADARITDLQGQIDVTRFRLDATRAEIARYRGIVRARAAFIYTHASSPQMLLDIPHVEDVSSGKQYAQSATNSDANRITDFTRSADALDVRLRDFEQSRDDEQQRRDTMQRVKIALETENDRQKKLLDDAGTIPVMGDSVLTGEQIAAWFDARGVRYRLSGGTTIVELADMFVEEGKVEHVRGDIAFAQSILETGSFGHALDNNYGGIGACDSCNGEIAFPTPRDGARGQIHMLKNYADPESRASSLANPPSPPIYGSDPASAAVAYDTFFAKGRVPTWNLMGNGNWATSPVYAPKVLGIYFEMVAFAARRN